MTYALAAQLSQHVSPSSTLDVNDRRLKKVIEYIHDNLADDRVQFTWGSMMFATAESELDASTGELLECLSPANQASAITA
jgi:hypothetical protein